MSYVHALGHDLFTPAYDMIVRLTMPELRLRRAALALCDVQPGQRVLDIGCGTGTLAGMLRRAHPRADVVGLDGDARILAIARRKARDVRFVQATADALPFDDSSVDVATSTLVFHHLTRDVKRAALRDILRVLRPGGRFVLVDWGRAIGSVQRLAARAVAWLAGADRVADHFEGRLPALLAEAGFRDITEIRRERTLYGPLVFTVAIKGDST